MLHGQSATRYMESAYYCDMEGEVCRIMSNTHRQLRAECKACGFDTEYFYAQGFLKPSCGVQMSLWQNRALLGNLKTGPTPLGLNFRRNFRRGI